MRWFDGDPKWRHRRTLVYTVTALSIGMIVSGGLMWRADPQVASQLIIVGGGIVTTVLTVYVGAATYGDRYSPHIYDREERS